MPLHLQNPSVKWSGQPIFVLTTSPPTNADRIFVLREGRVEESGTHDALVAANGLYAKMWQDYQTSVSWKVGAAK